MVAKFSRVTMIPHIQQYVASEPDPDADSLDLLAYCELVMHEFSSAAKRADEALRARPGDARALAIRGSARLEPGELDLARADFAAALTADPHNALAARGRALAPRRESTRARR